VRHEAAARAARLACAEGPPVGGTFQFQIFIQTPSPEIWSETISEVLGAEVGWPIFGVTSFRKKFRQARRGTLCLIRILMLARDTMHAVRAAAPSPLDEGVTSSVAGETADF
jgi:hypothetical protein